MSPTIFLTLLSVSIELLARPVLAAVSAVACSVTVYTSSKCAETLSTDYTAFLSPENEIFGI